MTPTLVERPFLIGMLITSTGRPMDTSGSMGVPSVAYAKGCTADALARDQRHNDRERPSLSGGKDPSTVGMRASLSVVVGGMSGMTGMPVEASGTPRIVVTMEEA